ncbi:MAG: hypothetical protein R3E12_07430 [Candidatus Eisenbacteria bacterium]
MLFARSNQTLAAGSGTVANLSFQLRGSANQSALSPSNIVLSDVNANGLTVTGQAGVLTVTGGGGGGGPRLDVAVLKNPGRERTMQIFVTVEDGSGNPPSVTAGGQSVTMTALAAGVFQGTFSATQSTSSVAVSASDTNNQGTGTDQVTVSF